MLRYLTSGESHGQSLITIIEGIPSNLHIDIDNINKNYREDNRDMEEEIE